MSHTKQNPKQEKTPPSKAESWKMFDEIAARYDFLNHLFSFGLTGSWRRKIASFLPKTPDLAILDVATGTGDVLLALLKMRPDIQTAHGIDLADRMLTIGRQKVKKNHFENRIILSRGDADKIPFPDNHFDVVTMAFGIRNMPNVMRTLQEILRVLKSGGQALILEFSLPTNAVMRAFYLFYLRSFIPVIGACVSGNRHAYRYLNETVEGFPYGDAFCTIMNIAGFKNPAACPLTGGIVTIYRGNKK